MKFKKIISLVLCFMILGFVAQFLPAYGEEPKKDNKAVQPVLSKDLADTSVSDYCKRMRSMINSMADILYSSYGYWEDEKRITVFFNIYPNGKLDESSISFPSESTDDKVLRNLTILTLKKSFAMDKQPFPKELQSHKVMQFKIALLFKMYERKETANPSPSSIGVVVGDINDDIRAIYGLDLRKGIFVAKVLDDRPAKIAGIKNYDAIYAANGKSIKTTEDFSRFLEKNPGDITVTTNRGNFLVKR